ncbi:putative toxin-antitoxin system toxin component, PIN family [Cupriavidus necator]
MCHSALHGTSLSSFAHRIVIQNVRQTRRCRLWSTGRPPFNFRSILIVAEAYRTAHACHANVSPYAALRDLGPRHQPVQAGVRFGCGSAAAGSHRSDSIGLVVPSSLQVQTVKQLVDLAKVSPGKIFFASAGVGNVTHLAAALFNKRAAIQVTHVPYNGSAPAIADLVSGQTQYMTDMLNSSLPPPDVIYRAWRAARLELVTSTVQLGELRRVSRYPKLKTLLPAHRISTMLNNMQPAIVLHPLQSLPEDVEAADPNDTFLLAMALTSEANYLVTGDRRAGLLQRGSIGCTRIVTPGGFCAEAL